MRRGQSEAVELPGVKGASMRLVTLAAISTASEGLCGDLFDHSDRTGKIVEPFFSLARGNGG